MPKDVCCTTDFVDNLLYPRGHELPLSNDFSDWRFFTEQDIDDLMGCCAAMGATRHEWILGDNHMLYDADSPLGFDLLRVACEAAHRHGMRFDAVFKPFDGGGYSANQRLPLSFPKPSGAPFLEEPDAIVHGLRPFIARHPELRMARAPEDGIDPGGFVAKIRLVKPGNDPTGIRTGDLEILTSRGGPDAVLETYDGPVDYREITAYRPVLPYQEASCRVLTLSGLRIPPETAFIDIRCKATHPVDLCHYVTEIVELVNADGRVIPSQATPSGEMTPDAMRQLRQSPRRLFDPYLRHPEVKRILDDPAAFAGHVERMNRLRTTCGNRYYPKLDPGCRLVVMRGKPRYFGSLLNPVYPEVQAHWLERVRFCLERGVDGVNIRTQGHNWPVDPWAYGFNAPTLAQVTHPENTAEVSRINGNAYTAFMRAAADLCHAAGKEMGVHIYTTMIGWEQRPHALHGDALVPWNMEWQWETWIREIADYVEFRGAFTLKPEHLRRIVDRIGLACREAGKRFMYQSSRAGGVVSFDGPHDHLAWEIDAVVKSHPDIDLYNFYETACFTRFDPNGRLECSPGMTALALRVRS